MQRKTLLFSASVICLSLFSGAAFAERSPAITSKPLSAPGGAQTLLAKSEGGAAAAAKEAGKKAKDKAASTMAKGMKDGKAAAKEGKSAAAEVKKAAKETKGAAAKETAGKKKSLKEKLAGTMDGDKKTAKAAGKTAKKRSKPKGETTLTKQNRHDSRTFTQAAGNASCICVEGHYCVGPRNGHYCITSGGNKRYLSRH